MQLEPYLFFYGRCEEALNFYKDVFGGEIASLNRWEGSPMGAEMSANRKSKIMHSSFKSPGMSFLASDGPETHDVRDSNISLSLASADAAEAKRVFDKLSQGGNVEMPMQDAFWGGKFGMVTDKFGIDWMMSVP